MSKKASAASTVRQPPLAGKDGSVFRDLMKLYDEKHYKKTVKLADGLLKKMPDHGETIAMKAVSLFNMNRKAEGYELIKQAAKHDIRSPLIWHIYGSMHKADKNMTEALKCLKLSLKYDLPGGAQSVLRELATMYVQSRDYRAHHDIRRQLLTANSKVAAHWSGLAVAHHLAGNCELALAVLEQFEASQALDPASGGGSVTVANAPTHQARAAAVEASELILYKARILEQMGLSVRALKTLSDGCATGRIADALFASQRRAEIWITLNRPQNALELYLELLRVNPEHYGYHAGLQACLLGLPLELALLDAGRGAALQPPPASKGGAAAIPSPPAEGVALSESQVDLLLAVYGALGAAYPKSRACARIPLDFLPASHPAFLPLLGAYVRTGLRRGIPSLFVDLKPLYRASGEKVLGWGGRQATRAATQRSPFAPPTAKAAVLGGLIAQYLAAVTAEGAQRQLDAPSIADVHAVVERCAAAVAESKLKLTPAAAAAADPALLATPAGCMGAASLQAMCKAKGDAPASPDAAPSLELPSLLPWVILLAARHADELGDTAGALELLARGVQHSPTVIDLYVAQARALKHRGALRQAADTMDGARLLDLADRYLNSKTTKYLLRCGAPEAAVATIALFTKHDSKDKEGGDPLGNLSEMQVMWFELEFAACHERAGDLALALKHYRRVQKHFEEWVDDQTDFHAYCLRRMALRAYVDFLATEDCIHSHSYFLRAMAGAARCFVALSLARAGGGFPAAVAAAVVVGAPDAGAAAAGATSSSSNGTPATAAAPPASSIVAASPAPAAATAGDKQDEAAEEEADKAEAAAAAAAAAALPKDDDLLGTKLIAACTKPLLESHGHARLLTDNLPTASALRSTLGSVSSSAPASAMATPTAGTAMQRLPTCSALLPPRGWNTSPDQAVAAHALAADVSLARGRVLQAAAHLRAAEAVAPASSTVAQLLARGAAPPALAPGHLHPLVWLTAARVIAAAEAATTSGKAPATAALGAALTQFLGGRSAAAFRAESGAALAALGIPHATVVVRARLEAEHGLPALPAGFPALPATAVAGTAAPSTGAREALGLLLDAATAEVDAAARTATLRDAVAALQLAQDAARLIPSLAEGGADDVAALRRALLSLFPAADDLAEVRPTAKAPAAEGTQE